MSLPYIKQKRIQKQAHIPMGEYDQCLFENCDFTEADFSNFTFTDCQFKDCNLSLIKVLDTTFQQVMFKNCKMLGVAFSNCNPFGLVIRFENCQLNHSSFHASSLKNTLFSHSQMHEVDFSDAALQHAVFHHCDLAYAIFDQSNLEHADFRTAINYAIRPENNRIKKAKFSMAGLEGLVQHYDILVE